MFVMAHQLLGRPIQPTYILASHMKCFFWNSPPSLLTPVFLNPSPSKHCFTQTPSLSSYRSHLCTATSEPAAALIKDQQQKQLQLPLENEDYDDDTEYEEEYENFSGEEIDSSDDIQGSEGVASSLERAQSTNASTVSSRRIPQLTVKEKKQLNSYANGLGKKLKCHQVGKSGVTSSVKTSISDALEANELIKLKVHGTCPGDPDAVASQLQEATRSVAVGKIGRTFILYRPSPRKVAPTEMKKPSPRPQQQQKRRIAKPAGLKNRKA